ncbi:MAG: RidA family protein [Chloroflexota bacterium]
MRMLHPPDWARPQGYSHGVAAEGRLVFTAGQLGCLPDGSFVANNFVAQARQALLNVVAVLAEAGASPEHIVRLNWYVLDRYEYLETQRELHRIYLEIIGEHFPAMTVLDIDGLVEEEALLQIEATAVIPDGHA